MDEIDNILEEKQLQLEAILKFSPALISIKDPQGRIVLVSRNFEMLKGPSPDEYIGKNVHELFPQEIADALWRNDQIAFSSKQPIEAEEIVQHKDDSWHTYLTVKFPLFRNTQDPYGVCAISTDITVRKQLEDQLARTLAEARRAEHLVKLGTYEWDHIKAGIVTCSLEYAHIFELSVDEMLQFFTSREAVISYIHPEDRQSFTSIADAAMSRGTGFTAQYRLLLPSGRVRHVREVCEVELNEQGEVLRTAGSIQDVTQQILFEEELRQAQKMEAIGILTGGIAHEFNNLLTPILGFTEMLMRDKSKDDPDWKSLEQVEIAGNRARDLIQQLLAYGRKSLSVRKPVQLGDIIEDVIKLTENVFPPNISVKKEIQVDLPLVSGATSEIHQVLLNLFLNANDAMPQGGDLMIRTQMHSFHQFTNAEGHLREGPFVSVSVQDNGIGMEQATLDRIFDPFFTTKRVGQGTGLGLSVIQGIMEQHQGHIEVDTKIAKGTRFQIYFPVAQEAVKKSVEETEKLVAGNERILLIDDEPSVIAITRLMLEKLGYKVIDFIDCIEAIQQFSDCPQEFELVITDYGMPSMNGKQLAEKIREIRTDIPIILITGYGDLVQEEDIDQLGMDDLLMKPIHLKHLSATVRRVLDNKLVSKAADAL